MPYFHRYNLMDSIEVVEHRIEEKARRKKKREKVARKISG